VTLEIVDAFPDIPVLFSLGNNDVEYHNMAPSAEIKPEYYAELWRSTWA
jgi:hypothetical protein